MKLVMIFSMIGITLGANVFASKVKKKFIEDQVVRYSVFMKKVTKNDEKPSLVIVAKLKNGAIAFFRNQIDFLNGKNGAYFKFNQVFYTEAYKGTTLFDLIFPRKNDCKLWSKRVDGLDGDFLYSFHRRPYVDVNREIHRDWYWDNHGSRCFSNIKPWSKQRVWELVRTNFPHSYQKINFDKLPTMIENRSNWVVEKVPLVKGTSYNELLNFPSITSIPIKDNEKITFRVYAGKATINLSSDQFHYFSVPETPEYKDLHEYCTTRRFSGEFSGHPEEENACKEYVELQKDYKKILDLKNPSLMSVIENFKIRLREYEKRFAGVLSEPHAVSFRPGLISQLKNPILMDKKYNFSSLGISKSDSCQEIIEKHDVFFNYGSYTSSLNSELNAKDFVLSKKVYCKNKKGGLTLYREESENFILNEEGSKGLNIILGNLANEILAKEQR